MHQGLSDLEFYGDLSRVYLHTLQLGANLHTGCIFGHVNGVLRICTRVQGCKLAPTFEVVQIVHMNALPARVRI